MDDVEIRKVLVKRVGCGERTREEVLVSDVNIDGRNLLKYGNKRGDKKRIIRKGMEFSLCFGYVFGSNWDGRY